jgi:hypothetical protein
MSVSLCPAPEFAGVEAHHAAIERGVNRRDAGSFVGGPAADAHPSGECHRIRQALVKSPACGGERPASNPTSPTIPYLNGRSVHELTEHLIWEESGATEVEGYLGNPSP